jgi:hypothetical protein
VKAATIICYTRRGLVRRKAYSDARRALVITRAIRPHAPEDRFGIMHRKTGFLVCGTALFATVLLARKALRAMLPILPWDYDGQQDAANDQRARRDLAKIQKAIARVKEQEASK